MKILCVIDSLGSGGAQRQLVNLAIGFVKIGHNVSFLIYHDDIFYSPVLKKNDIQISLISEKNYFQRVLKIRNFIKNAKVDSVLSFTMSPNFISELSSFPFKKWTLVVSERSANPQLMRSARYRLYRLMHFFANSVVSNSHENIRMIKKSNPFLPDKKLFVINNMVDLEDWKPIQGFKYKTDNKSRLLIAASHQYLKNLNNLIEAVALLAPHDRNNLIIEWYGEIRDNSFKEAQIKIKQYCIEDNFNFYSATQNISEIMQKSDCVGLFSFYEGFPNVICEGMACGKPIISSMVSDIPFIIKEDENAFLCDATSIKSIASALTKFINSDALILKRIGFNNRTKAELLFNPTVITESYLKLLSNG